MKILMIAPTPFFSDRGTHIRILEEALALEERGHQITIATYHIGGEINNRVKTQIDVRRIQRLLFWYKKLEAGPDWQKVILDLMLLRKAFYLARTQKPTIIHAHLHEGVIIGWFIQKLLFWRQIKLVADFHGSLTKEMVSHGYLHYGLKRIFIQVEKFINNLGDVAIASSQELSEDIALTRKDKKVITVLDGVNLKYYKTLPDRAELRKEFELPFDKKIIVYTGALIANKGLKYLLEAIPEIKKAVPEAFFLVGGFPKEEMEKFLKDNQLESQSRLVCPLDYFILPKVLKASDLGVDPKDSGTRQASGKILQYMGAGLPVACFDRENNRAYLGEGGVYAPEITGKSLASVIIEALNQTEVCQKKGQINATRAYEFSWQKSAELLEKLYLE